MRRPIAILSAFALSLAGAVAAPPKIAFVRITDIYVKLPSTEVEQNDIKALHANIYKDSRNVELGELIKTLQGLQEEITKLREVQGGDQGRLTILSREYERKLTGLAGLQREFETFHDEQVAEINHKMVGYMRASLNRIAAEAKALGEKEGYDWVLDSSGESNTGVPVVLYAKNAPDLTDKLFAILVPQGASGSTAAQPPSSFKPTAPAPPTPVH